MSDTPSSSKYWHTRAGRKKLLVVLLVASALVSTVNVSSSSPVISSLCIAVSVLISALGMAVLIKHVASRADPR